MNCILLCTYQLGCVIVKLKENILNSQNITFPESIVAYSTINSINIEVMYEEEKVA
jgi:hypothetical protein